MVKKSLTTQEMANAYPEWTKVRSDEQSVGQNFLNVIGENLELLETEIFRAGDNAFLTTAFAGEIDLTYQLSLPESFEFDTDNPNAINPVPLYPTVSGLVSSGNWVNIEEVESGNISDFWYNATPTRLTHETTWSGVENEICIDTTDNVSLAVTNSGLFEANNLYVSASGIGFMYDVIGDELRIAKLRLSGETWKGATETEEIEFLYNQERRSRKAFKRVDTVEALDFPTTATVEIHGHGFNRNNYIDPYRDMQQFKEARNNLPCFWDHNVTASGNSTLEMLKYESTTTAGVLQNFTDLVSVRQWELLSSSGLNIDVLNIHPQPYSRRVWVLDENYIRLFDLDWDIPQHSLLSDRTQNSKVKIELDCEYPVRGDTVTLEAVFERRTKTIGRHRLTIQYPDGTSYGIDADENLVSSSSDYWISGSIEDKFLRHGVQLEAEDLGTHLLTLEVVYLDGTTDKDVRAFIVGSKTALAEFYIADELTGTPVGVTVDHLNRLCVIDDVGFVYHFQPRYDHAIVDYRNKTFVFREAYEEVKVVV